LDEPSQPVGLYRGTRPLITEVGLEPGLMAVIYTDGLTYSGDRCGLPMDVASSFRALIEETEVSAQSIADMLLEEAMRLDEQRPSDDISVAVVSVMPRIGDQVRRMNVRLPLDS
jgi:serine phosphatase RsbU (regulator of sigma subunit)